MCLRLMRLLSASVVSLAAFVCAAEAEQVGQATLITTSVTGDGSALSTKSPVHRNERIKTSNTGLGEFVFKDGTRFAVGSNSSVVIDKFVYAGDSSVKNLTINAARGSFRWISGGSNSSAYKIATPAGTIGIRGTAFDVFIGQGGATAVVLLKGSVQFCGANGCRDLRKRCDYIVATPGKGISDPKRLDRDALQKLRSAQAFPFITGKQRLSGRFRVGGGCMAAASLTPERKAPSISPPTPGFSPAPSPDPAPNPSPSKGKGNNGKGNGGGDGSPNGRNDAGR
jgi:hypothetical protein